MTNYRRLISYIYAYEGGVKGKNVGYAKIEVRGGQCKIGVSVKRVYVGSNDIGVYLLAGEREVYLGNIFIRNGGGDFRAVLAAANIDGQGLTMDECHGVTIHDVESTWQSYTTIWEDAVAHAAEIELADVTSENRLRQEKAEQQKQQERKEIMSEAESTPPLEVIQPPEAIQQLEAMESTPPLESIQPPEAVVSTELEQPDVNMDAGDDRPRILQAVRDHLPEPGDAQELEKLARQELEETNHEQIWDHYQKHYPKIRAFDYEHGCEIISIHPQDIGLLPREIWTYGNNSFLLHGYYNYRYLILARLDNPEGNPRYLLGVPGHYYSNEKYMASMFGFPSFVLSRQQPQQDGRFGYWYTDIRI